MKLRKRAVQLRIDGRKIDSKEVHVIQTTGSGYLVVQVLPSKRRDKRNPKKLLAHAYRGKFSQKLRERIKEKVARLSVEEVEELLDGLDALMDQDRGSRAFRSLAFEALLDRFFEVSFYAMTEEDIKEDW